jgi:hypothetical protein
MELGIVINTNGRGRGRVTLVFSGAERMLGHYKHMRLLGDNTNSNSVSRWAAAQAHTWSYKLKGITVG